MHKRCREIMDELILNGELEEITWFKFAPKQELKLRLKDMLEDSVDSKYLLSNKLVSYFEKHKEEQKQKGNGFGWQPLDENSEISFTITNLGKTRPNETYIRLNQTHHLNIKGNDSIKRICSSDGLCPSLTTMQGGHREPKVAIENAEVKIIDDTQGFDGIREYKDYAPTLRAGRSGLKWAIANGVIEIENDEVRVREAVAKVNPLATEGDSINISVPSSKTRRGRVGKQVAQTLDTACNQVVFSNINKFDTNIQLGYNGVNEKELEYEKSTFNQKDTIEILRILWGEAREEAFKKWGLGINDSFYQEEILQQRLHGKEFCENRTKQSGLFIGSFICETDKQTFYRERFLPTMWKAWKSRCTSYRRGLSEQQSIQFNDFMQKLSYERTYCEADMQYRKLQYESQRIWVLRKALSKIQKMGRSNENKKTEKHNYIFRKLTERECFRLQGFDDSFIFPPKISSTQLYKQAGNGMSRNILDMIFTQIFTCYVKHIESKQYCSGGYIKDAHNYVGIINN